MKLQFADCLIDLPAHRLTRDGAEVHVEPQVFDLLCLVAGTAPAMVGYDDMIAEVWKGRIVSDATVSARISAARAAVGDSGKAQAVIRTVPRRGIQMAVPVTREEEGEPPGREAENAPPHQTIRYATSAVGTAVAFAVSGEGPPLLRGGHWLSHLEHDWTSPMWRPLLERLGRGRRLIRHDPRGTGLSQRDPPDMSLQAFLADMRAVHGAADPGPVDIFATSQSVPVSLAFAARYPDRVRRLVLVNGFARGNALRGDAAASEAMIAMIRSGWAVPGSPFTKAIATLFAPTATADEVESLVEVQSLSASAEMAAWQRQAIAEIDVTDRLAQVRAPVLVMSSRGDAVHPSEFSREIAQALPDARFHMLDTTSHAIPPSDPAFADMMAETDRFLAG